MFGSSFTTSYTHVAQANGPPELIDISSIEILCQDVGSIFGSLIETFLEEMRARIAAMRLDVVNRNDGALTREAHSIAGTAATLGFSRLSANARKLEASAKSLSPELAAALISEIERVFVESCVELEHSGFVSRPAAGSGR